jgi:CHAT domain-containing protein
MKFFSKKIILLFVIAIATILLGSQFLPTTATENVVDRASARVAAARIVQLERGWQGQYQDYFGRRFNGRLLNADQIGETLRRLTNETHKKLALIYVSPNTDELELLMVIPGQPPLRKTLPDVPQQTLLTTINEFKSQVARPAHTRGYLRSAKQLHDWIIAPLEADLQTQGIDTLIFCVGRNLRSVPFAALHDGQKFLVEKYNLGLIPAFHLSNHNYRNVHNVQVLAMGASVFQKLPALPAVPLELLAIAQNRWRSQTFLNQDFTRENLEEKLASRDFGIVHLATHAEFRPGAPNNSYIQLWQDQQLSLDQLWRLDWSNLPIELLVLSACQTALGDEQAELGFAGLAYQAGVKSSLASLWRISDVGTLALMREFYWQLANSTVLTKAEALRNAQIAMLKGQVRIVNGQIHSSGSTLPLPSGLEEFSNFDMANPYFWATFVLVGSPW